MFSCSFVWAQGATLKNNGEYKAVINSGGTSFPDYSQPTTRYVTTGQSLRNTRKFGLGEQMYRESPGIFGR